MRNELHSQTKWLSIVFRAVVFSVRECPFHLIANKQALRLRELGKPLYTTQSLCLQLVAHPVGAGEPSL